MINKIFLKKEINEIIHTNKIIVLPALFLFFAILSPLTARYIGELIGSMANKGQVKVTIPPPVAFHAYAQLFKNFHTISMFMLFIFMGCVSDEKVKGSVALVLTKGVSRLEFLVSKLLSNLALITASIIVSTLVFIFYSYQLFPDFNLNGLFLALLVYWLYSFLLLSMMVFASTIAKNNSLSALFGFVLYIVMAIISAFPTYGKFSPSFLQGADLSIIEMGYIADGGFEAIISTIILSALFIASSIYIFKKQDL